MPDPNERIGAQQRNDGGAEHHVELRIPEHRRDVHGQVQQQPLHRILIVQHTRLELRDVRELLRLDSLPQPATNRRVRVRSEIEAVLPEDSLQQELDLHALELRAVAGGRAGHAAARRIGLRSADRAGDGLHVLQRYSHTRMRLSSCSVSTGFVM